MFPEAPKRPKNINQRYHSHDECVVHFIKNEHRKKSERYTQQHQIQLIVFFKPDHAISSE